MKGKNVLYSFLFCLSLAIVTNSYELPEVQFIISATLNGTSTYVPLEYMPENLKYIYLSFDFNFHSTKVPESKDIAYFEMSTSFSVIDHKSSKKESISYGMTTKQWTEINKESDIGDVSFKDLDIIFSKPNNDFNFYVQVKKESESDNTLLIRIPTYGLKEGYINISNILSLPKME